MKYDKRSSFGTSNPAGASRPGYLGRVIISKLDRPVMSLRVDFVPFPMLEVSKLSFLPRPMERTFIRDHTYAGLHFIRELVLAVRIVADGTDERTREMDGQAAVPGFEYDLERLVVCTADLHGGEKWFRQSQGNGRGKRVYQIELYGTVVPMKEHGCTIRGTRDQSHISSDGAVLGGE